MIYLDVDIRRKVWEISTRPRLNGFKRTSVNHVNSNRSVNHIT